MKKRLDMIEQFVDSTKSYAHFEQETLEKITSMRTGIASAGPGDLKKIQAASQGLAGSIFAVAESYPDLKTSQALTATMSAIRDVEDEISRYRYTYNNIVQEFNTMGDTLPSIFIASFAGMRDLEYLSFEEDELRRAGYLTSDETEPRKPEAKWQ